ncbi:MAG: formate dehydrogenase subunit alpha [Bacteriovoracaceae bacterium]|jgi:formate dehydrogenase major subunit|nr:formate dehydrogenase subunit alpha [Bacteriovoracaceae bacterium]
MKNSAFINDKLFAFEEGDTILSFLKRNTEESIPTLCHDPNLTPFGSCRLCSVEVANDKDGETKVVASCHTPLSLGLYIYPHSKKIKKLRKNILELILSDHNYDCDNCDADKNCDLQSAVEEHGDEKVRYTEGANHQSSVADEDHPYLRSHLENCINCYRCIRACDEVQGQFVLSMKGRGFDAQIIKGADQSFSDSDCVSCGSCVQTCPTNAITDVFHKPLPASAVTTRTICTYCGVGCNLDVTACDGKIHKIEALGDAEVNSAHTCVKGRYAFRFYNHPDRLKSPMIKRDGKFENVSWDQAYDFIAEKLTQIKKDHGADAIGGISSSRCTNEENYLMQKFIRAAIKTNNIDGCARVCHAPTALGMQRVFGTGAATNSIADLKSTECILIVGANPTSAHPVTGAKIKQKAIKGCPLIVIDPHRTELAALADVHLQLRPGTNVAVLNMVFYYILTEGRVDTEFIESRCEGFDEFKKEVLAMDIGQLSKVSGVSEESARQAAVLYSGANLAMSFHGLGVTEHAQGTFAVMMIAQLALITGNVGKSGCGVNPLRGQNNVQGAADMGVQPHQGAGYLDVTDPEINALYEKIYKTSVPSEVGLKIPEMIEKAGAGEFKALWVIGEDISQTEPNVNKVNKCIDNLELLVVQELFMTETAKHATVILPASSFFEKDGTFTNGERRVQRVNRVIDPTPGTKPDGQIICEMMNKMGYPQKDFHPKFVLEEISQIVPFFAGITWDNLQDNGLQWPVGKDGVGTTVLHTETFKRGLGLFQAIHFEETAELVKHQKEFPFILTTVRDLTHYNCGAMTRRTDNNEIVKSDFLLIHPLDANESGIVDGGSVELSSHRGSVNLVAKFSEDVKRGILQTTFHFPEVMINKITSNTADSESLCPEYKVTAVKLN